MLIVNRVRQTHIHLQKEVHWQRVLINFAMHTMRKAMLNMPEDISFQVI